MKEGSRAIIGHKRELALLRDDIAQGNVAHAYLFAGPKGIGKFTVAKWFARELLTQGVEEAEKAHAEDQILRLLHADLHVLDRLWMEGTSDDLSEIARFSNVSQEHRKKAKAKTDTISIDDIRALQERLHDVGNGRFKCCLIRSVERMQDEAVNALLKILEEPPAGVVFVLTTEAQSSLLATLVSRARFVRFSRVADREIDSLLTGQAEEDRRFILRIAQGAPGTALRLAGDPDQLRLERVAYTNASQFWRSTSLLERLTILKPLHEKKPEADRFLLHLALALREELQRLPPLAPQSFNRLVRGLETNTSRQLLAQQCAMAIGEGK